MTILQKLGLTQEELEAKYQEVGNLRLLSQVLGVSKTSLHKYLKHLTCETKPWDAAKRGVPNANIDYQRYRYRQAAMESFERAMLSRKTWTDVNGRSIPREALDNIYVEPPRKLSPLMPIYATLKGTGETVIFMFHPEVDWINQQEVQTSASETPDTPDPLPSDQDPE